MIINRFINLLSRFFKSKEKFKFIQSRLINHLRRLINHLRTLSNRFYFKKEPDGINEKKILHLIYDLNICPITYNLVDHIIIAELERLKRNLEFVTVIFVPGNNDLLRHEWEPYEKVMNFEMRYNRVYNMLLPILGMYKYSRGFLFFSNRKQAKKYINKISYKFPNNYTVSNPTYAIFREWKNYDENHKKKVFNLFNAKEYQQKQVKYFLEAEGIDLNKHKLVSISLRSSPWGNLTNSKIEEWIKFSNYLLSKNYKVIIIPDCEDDKRYSFLKNTDFIISYEASINVFYRYALYSLCYTNCLVANGIWQILNFSNIPFILFKVIIDQEPIDKNADVLSTREHVEKALNVNVDEKPEFLNENQKWTTLQDDCKNLISVFEDYIKTK